MTTALGTKVKERRQALLLSQTGLAQLVHLTQDRISNIERGKRKVSANELPLFAKALKCKIDWLCKEEKF